MVRIDVSLQVSHVGCEDPCLYHVLSNTACKKVLSEWLDRRELVEGGGSGSPQPTTTLAALEPVVKDRGPV